MTESGTKILVSICGLLGVIALGIYYSVPFPLPAPGASLDKLDFLVNHFHRVILLDSWLQGMGSALCVIFFLGLIHLS